MKYNHPIEIPRSKSLFFDWIGDRIPVASPNVKGDTHPMAWADDDKIYIGTGDPNWMVLDGNNYVSDPSRGGWSESPETYKGMSGQVVEVITGEPEAFQVHRVHDMPGYVGPGGGGPKPCGMICVDGKLYYAVQNLLGWNGAATLPLSARKTTAKPGHRSSTLCWENSRKNILTGPLAPLRAGLFLRQSAPAIRAGNPCSPAQLSEDFLSYSTGRTMKRL